jgi:hypothetical protein
MTEIEELVAQAVQRFEEKNTKKQLEADLKQLRRELGYDYTPVVFPASSGCQYCSKGRKKLFPYTGFTGLASFVDQLQVCASCLASLNKGNYQYYQATEQYWTTAVERIKKLTIDMCVQYTIELNKILMPEQLKLHKLAFLEVLDDLIMANKILVIGNSTFQVPKKKH